MDTCICGCGGGPCITQREYYRQRTDSTTEDELKEMILFRVKGKCGYPLKNALRKLYTNLDGRDDKVFVGFKSSISIRLEVSLTRRKDQIIALNPLLSGFRTRNGQDRLVRHLWFHRRVINHSSRSGPLHGRNPLIIFRVPSFHMK